ncbi:squalene/phytoene synthase family protein [Chloroflexota bacterium]
MKAQDINHFAFNQNLDFTQILANPILDIAARFWEDERYDAFKICYRSMRVVDDLVDDRKSTFLKISEVEKLQLTAIVRNWLEAISNATPYDSFQKQLAETRARFQIPLWPWVKLSKSMIYDLHHKGFRDFPAFLRYSQGAAVAPGSIFMHLCGVVNEREYYRPPHYDIRTAAKPLALFCYLVHIIRDFQKDQINNLNYFADNLMTENGLNQQLLKEIATGSKISPGFRTLMEKYYDFAEYYRHKARLAMDRMSAYLEPRYQLSLEIIYSLYLQIFERIDILNGRFTTAELCPLPEEVQNRIKLTVSSFESNHEESKR